MRYRSVWMWTIVLGITFAMGLVIGRYEWPLERMPALEQIAGGVSVPGHKHEHDHATTSYVCPMHPEIVSDKPGTCPICGMALVPAKQDGHEMETAADAQPVIRIAPEVIDNLGVKTVLVKRTTLVRRIETPGFVQEIQPGKTARVQAPFDARIAALPFKPDQWLEQGQPLVVLDSPTLLAAEQAHLALLAGSAMAGMSPDAAAKSSADATIPQSAAAEESRLKLATLGLSTDGIRKLEHGGTPSAQLTLYTPYPGTVTNLQVKAGDSVPRGTPLFELSGMAHASVLANAFQRDAAWIQTGQTAEVKLPHVSNQVWPGVVNQGAVSIDPNSQNIGVRLSFTAPPQLLRSAMYVVASISGDAHQGVLAVPQQAVIRTETEDRVIIALGGGRFKPVPVHLGIESGDNVEVLGGLKEGDRIVVSAQFLIDSESSLQASYLRMTVP